MVFSCRYNLCWPRSESVVACPFCGSSDDNCGCSLGWGEDVPVQEDDAGARDQPNVFMQFLLEFNRENASVPPQCGDAPVATLGAPGPSAAGSPSSPGRAVAVS